MCDFVMIKINSLFYGMQFYIRIVKIPLQFIYFSLQKENRRSLLILRLCTPVLPQAKWWALLLDMGNEWQGCCCLQQAPCGISLNCRNPTTFCVFFVFTSLAQTLPFGATTRSKQNIKLYQFKGLINFLCTQIPHINKGNVLIPFSNIFHFSCY